MIRWNKPSPKLILGSPHIPNACIIKIIAFRNYMAMRPDKSKNFLSQTNIRKSMFLWKTFLVKSKIALDGYTISLEQQTGRVRTIIKNLFKSLSSSYSSHFLILFHLHERVSHSIKHFIQECSKFKSATKFSNDKSVKLWGRECCRLVEVAGTNRKKLSNGLEGAFEGPRYKILK